MKTNANLLLDNIARHSSSENLLNARLRTFLIELYLKQNTVSSQALSLHQTTGVLRARSTA